LREKEGEYYERVIELKRVSKVVKGGKRFKLYACVVVGDGQGRVGIAHAKAPEVAPAIKKATQIARKNMVKIPIIDGAIPHQVIGKFGASKVLLKPASVGTGIIASTAVRAVCEAAGIRNILTKSFGSNNPTNLARAALAGLQSLLEPEAVARMRDKPVEIFLRRRRGEKDQDQTDKESDLGKEGPQEDA